MIANHITIGIDEVGRGSWAGPLVVAATALDMTKQYVGLADSKVLSAKRRLQAATYIKQVALGIGIGWVDSYQLDSLGMTSGLKLATQRAYAQLPPQLQSTAQQIVIDGNISLLNDPRVLVLVKADAKVQAVSAASIVAKVARDNYMIQLAQRFTGYGLEHHVGYGTKEHQLALNKYGIIPGLHRLSFAPIKRLLGETAARPDKLSLTSGRQAEAVAASYLISLGYSVVCRNWRVKSCEIDIVAHKQKCLYFVEVKYRVNNHRGGGLEAITPSKLAQMEYSAKTYLHYHKDVASYDASLMAISLMGDPPVVEKLVVLT